ncbi:MAG: MucR family transcriptional regulator [Deltaproteobacteria bacterium]|nr:MucR family transcriptional regulator [Deltaproteobacteria bacterium]MDH3382801.1 MucR family transcriptional regulator [Deltaproteobacteria bacterium]
MDKRVLVELTTEIVSAHASVNEMNREELLDEIQEVFQKLNALVGVEGEAAASVAAAVKPAIPLNAAFGAEQVFCMECGKGFTTLKKHLAVSHNLSPKDYRKKFNIPTKTPLVARNYSEAKKKIAQKLGLAEKLAAGRKKRGK